MKNELLATLLTKEAEYARITKIFWDLKRDEEPIPAIIRAKVIAAKAAYQSAENVYNDYISTGIDPFIAMLQGK